MTSKKLIARMRELLDLKRRKQRDQLAKIKGLLAKLRKHRRALKKALDDETDLAQRKRIKRDLKVLHEQRRKGLKLVKELRKKS